jgi:cyanophycin synthetase
MDLSQSKKGEWKIRIERATHVPLTLGGQIHDCLGSNLSQLCLGFKTEDISLSLQLSFQALLKHGRMNIFEFKNSKC